MNDKPKEDTPFDKFRKVVQKVVSVPKKEIDKREKKWKKNKKTKVS